MRNKEEEEIPLVNIERNPWVLVISLAVSALMAWLAYRLFVAMNPWGFLVAGPAVVISFQTLWLMLNPYAIVFENKVEIRQSFLHQKDWYFVDIRSVAKNKKGKLFITYHDSEIERVPLFGIKAAHVDLMKSELESKISGVTA